MALGRYARRICALAVWPASIHADMERLPLRIRLRRITPVLILQGAWDVDCARKRVPRWYPHLRCVLSSGYRGGRKIHRSGMSSSSGGLATAISEAFVASNGLVCSCAQEGGEFRFHLTSDADYLRRDQGSKYVKSNPLGAYREVREALQGGQRVLFIGLPCQVAAMRNFVGSRLADSLYTIDLICHGSPSPKVLSRFLEETGNNLSNELILWVGRVSAIATRLLSSRVYRIRKAATPAATPRVIVSPILRLAIHGVASFLMRSRTGYPSHLCRQTRVENC